MYPKEEFKPSGKVWEYAFGDYFYKLHADSANRGIVQYSSLPKDANTFDFRRAYLGHDYNISEKFSTEFILAYEGQTLSDNSRTVFIKSANLRWKKIYKNADLVFGLQPTPCWSFITEKLYGYRSIEKTIFDIRKHSSSADLGIGLQGKLNEKGDYGYNFFVANGTGAKPENDRYKKVYGEVYAKFLDQKLIFDLYADWERASLLPMYHKSKTSFKFAVIYKTDAFTVGVEAFEQLHQNFEIHTDTTAMKTDTGDIAQMGISVFTTVRIIKEKLNFFARFDSYNPDLNFNSDWIYSSGANPNTEMSVFAGFDFTPHKNVHIMPNVWYNAYTSRVKNISGLAKSDNDLVARITLYYIFK